MCIASLLLATPTLAQDQAVCDDLRGQLANIPETIGVNHQLQRYSADIIQQHSEIQRADNALRDSECSASSVVVVGSQDNQLCASIEASKKQMQQNLRQLVARQKQLGSSTGLGADPRNDLLAALHANGCDSLQMQDGDTIITNRRDVQPEAEPDEPLNAAIIPMDQSGGPSNGSTNQSIEPSPSYSYGESYAGNVRTVCVRTCDGGFFPMTAGANPGDFQRDGQTCARMCPGIKTELFFHRWPNQETSAMVSASTGAPYSAMPYAFAYRKRPPNEKSSCTCNLPAYYEEMRRQNALSHQDSGTSNPQGSIVTIAPQSTPAPEQTAKTNPPAPASQPIPNRPYDPSASKVRQVGPQFLSGNEGKIDLTHPAAPGPQPEQ